MLVTDDEVEIITLATPFLVLWNIQVMLGCGRPITLHVNVTSLLSISVMFTGASTISGGP